MIDHTETIKRIIGECSDLCKEEIDTITAEDNLNAFDIDSLSLVEIIFMLEKEFSIDIDVGDIDGSTDKLQKSKLTLDVLNKVINEKTS
jgi:acyl carrier protein